MRTIARFMDARNTTEGKFLSVLLSVLLVFSFLNVTMFTDYANAEDEEGEATEFVEPAGEPEAQAQPEDEADGPEFEEPAEEVNETEPAADVIGTDDVVVSDDTTKDSSNEPEASEVEIELQLVDATITYEGTEYSDGGKLIAPLGEDLKFSVKADETAEVKVAATIGDEDVVLSSDADGNYILKGDQVTDALAVIGAVAELKREEPVPSDTPTQSGTQEPTAEEKPETFEAEPTDETDEPSGIHRNPVVQIVFQVGAVTLAHSEFLTNGETVQLPFVADPDGKMFMGWTFEPAGFVDAFNKVVVPADQAWDKDDVTVIATAQFAEACTVTFKGERDNVVIATEKVAKGESLSADQIAAASAKYQVPAGKKFVGWEIGGEELTEQTVISDNIEASAIVADGTWVTFDSQGGTSVPSAQVREDGTIDCTAVPTRAGFDFDGWFTAVSGGDKVTADTKFESSATIYAHWKAHQVNYTVIYWQENANWDNQYLDEASRDKVRYSYVESETKTGTAGQMTSVSVGASDKGFKAARVENKEIAGDGSTIVNVYCDREVYSVDFKSLNCDEWLHGLLDLHDSSCYKLDSSKTITAKYGATIGSKWPGGFWSVNEGNKGPWQGNLIEMPLGGKIFSGQYDGTNAMANYYVQVLPGEKADENKEGKSYKLHHTDRGPSLQVTDEERYDIPGYTLNQSASTKNGLNYNGAKFYYDRNSYDVVFVSQGATVATAKRLFEQEVSGTDTSGYVPVRNGYTFGGWFQDQDCTVPAGEMLSGPMPARNLTVYAKWIAPQVQVKVHASTSETDDEGVYFTVDAGSVLDEIQLNEKAGIAEKIESDPNAFLGWFTKTPGGNWQPFDLSTPIDSEIELYARWRSDVYTVTYEIAAADAQLGLVAPIDGNKYADGALAVVKGIPVTAALDNQFANWVDENGNEVAAGSTLEMTRNITLTAVFKPVISYKFVDITYAPGNGSGSAYTKTQLSYNGITLIDSNADARFVAPDGYEFDCWNTKSDGTGDDYQPGERVRVKTSATLYAKWKPRGDLSYTVNYLEQGTDKILAPAKTVENQTFGETVEESAIEIEGYNKVAPETAGIEITTGENSLTFYYTARADLSYTVRYVEAGTGNEIAPAKTVDGQTFGATVEEEAIDVDGYVKPEGRQEITIAVTGNEIVFEYTKRGDLSYEVHYFYDGVEDESIAVIEDKATFGDQIPYEDGGDKLIHNGQTYLLDRVEGAGKVVTTTPSANIVNVYFDKDVIGEGSEDPYFPDGIPDKYQATVTYFVVNGTFGQGGTTSITEVITVAQKNADGSVAPVDYEMNAPENMIPAVGYDQQPGTWGDADFSMELKGGSAYTFTYVYGINNYSVNVSVANGTSNVGTVGTTGTYGSDLAYTFAPADGYALESVTVDGQPAVLTNGGYTFSALDANHSIEVVYAIDANRDGIPDSRQAIVNYNVANGTWADGSAATVTEYVDMFVYRNGEWEPVEPVLNVPVGMIANTGYSQASGAWRVDPAASQLIADGEVTFTYAFTAIPTVVVPPTTPVVPTAPVTPAAVTPVAPVTPAPAAPAPAAATPAPATETIEDDATPQAATPTANEPETIDDEATPMGAFDEPHCWVHWVMLLGILITAIYGIVVVRRRLHLVDEVNDYEKQVLGIEDEQAETVPATGHQAL